MLGGGPLYTAAVPAPPTAPGLTEFVKAPIRERAPTTNLIAGQGKFNPRLDEINFGQVGPRCPAGCKSVLTMDRNGHWRCICDQDALNARAKFASAPPQTQGGRRKTYKNKSKKHRKNKSHKYRGGGCSGTVSIANAVKMRNCSWTRTNNGKAKLAPKMNLSNNMNSYYN